MQYRLRAVAIAVRITFLALAAMLLYPLVPGRRPVAVVAYVALIVVAAAAVEFLRRLPWSRLLQRDHGLRVMYAWSALDIGLIGIAVALTGSGDSEMWCLYTLTTLFSASVYPRRGQFALLGFTCVSYASVAAAASGPVNLASVSFRLVVVTFVAEMGRFLAHELVKEMNGHHAAWVESEARSELLMTVAAAAQSMSTVDAGRVLDVVVASAAGMGCDGVEICRYDELGGTWSVDHRGGYQADYPAIQPIDAGVAGLLRRRGATVVLEDYRSWAGGVPAVRDAGFTSVVAIPIRSAGVLTGSLIVGTFRARAWAGHELESLELLAAQAGAALDLARLFAERDAFQEQLTHQAFHDGLTGLPNRSLFLDRLSHARARAARAGSYQAVLFVDLDRFKTVNDSLGHAAGDVLLMQVARRLGACLRPDDTLARYGGDEFTVLLEGLVTDGEAAEIAERLLEAMGNRFTVDGQDIFISASVGIAVAAPTDAEVRDLVRDADLAMYRAKRHGLGGCERFEAAMDDRAIRRLELELALRLAIERHQLSVLYQPIVELDGPHGAGQRLVGVEALVRWHHPERGELQPSEFVPLAEEAGLIRHIGSWVLEKACADAAAWERAGLHLGVAVNVSASQFDTGLPVLVREILGRTGLDPAKLTLEITESVVMDVVPSAVEVMHDLHALGVKLALDDFGQGYSSLSYLKQFPLDSVKLDKGFVDGVVENAEDRAIVQSVVALALALGFAVTAEGIESRDQLECLRSLGCARGQGYLFSRAVPARVIAALEPSVAA